MIRKLFLLYMVQTVFSLLLFSQTNNYNSKPKIYAVIVGVSDYKDPEIPNLKYAEKDALAFYDFLRSSNAGAVPEENIALLTGPEATRNNILNEVVEKFTRSNKEDLIIFYFSGHGKAGEFENTGYLLNYDAENGRQAGSALSMEEVKSKIDKCQAKMKISYIDACHAGLFTNSAKGTMEDENGFIVSAYLEGLSKANGGNLCFLASSARQQSQEDDKMGHGIFTYYLLKGLKGDADIAQEGTDGYNNGIVTTEELATYLIDKIQAATKYKQKPNISGDPDDFPLSVLRANISISNEISKRPDKKTNLVEKKKENPIPKEIPCNSELGNFCFLNNSKSEINIEIYKNNPGFIPSDYSKLVVKPGESKCLYKLPANDRFTYYAYKDNLNAKGFESKRIDVDKGELNIEQCKTNTQTIN